MEQINVNALERTSNYREVTVFDADEYYKEIHRAQRGWKRFSFAVNDTDTPNTCAVVKDGKLAAKITVILN